MTRPTSVTARIDADFRGADRDTAAALLPDEDELPLSPPYEHVLLAILTLAEGDLDAVRHYADSARSDWRDVLRWTHVPPQPDDPRTYEELRRQLGLPPEDESH